MKRSHDDMLVDEQENKPIKYEKNKGILVSDRSDEEDNNDDGGDKDYDPYDDDDKVHYDSTDLEKIRNIQISSDSSSDSLRKKTRSRSSDSGEDGDDESSGSPSSKKSKTCESSSAAAANNSWEADYGYYGYRGNQEPFEQGFICLPLSKIKKEHLEDGNRIIMPPSALERLAAMDIAFPMEFEIKNPDSGSVSHCGVLEFSADEGFVFLPNWMMKNLNLKEGERVMLKSVDLPKGKYMKIQPHRTDFINLTNPKAILEIALRSFSCVTTGDTIMITYNDKQYYIDIVETKPSNAISVVETDCAVDFECPLDYKEPDKKPETVVPSKQAENRPGNECCKTQRGREKSVFQAFSGTGRRLSDGELVTAEPVADGNTEPRKPETISNEVPATVEKKFQPFTGKKYTLCG